MSVRIFGTACDGEVVIQSLAPHDVENALETLNKSFFANECVCRGTEINLPESEQARKELQELCRQVATDGVSLIAKEVSTHKIVAVCFNKIQYTDDSQAESFFEKFTKTHCKSPNSQSLMDYMVKMDQEYDIFENYGIDCLLEIMFLSTLPEFEGKKIGRTLCSYSIELARELKAGIGVEQLNENIRNKRPQAVSVLFTSTFSQKIGSALGFKVLKEVPYTEYSFKGKTYAERIGPDHTFGVLCCIKL